jgi:hypothetical protein
MLHSGIFTERSPHTIAQALLEIKERGPEPMGEAARVAAEAWDWKHKAPAWKAALSAATAGIKRKVNPAPKRPKPQKGKPRILLVSDVAGWAFDVNERDMAEYCGKAFDFDRWHIAGADHVPAMSYYQAVFLPYHRWYLDHYWAWTPTLGSLRSADFDPTSPETMTEADRWFVRRCHGFHVVTRKALDLWGEMFPQMVYLTNPVNMKRFDKATTVDEVVCSWNGNAQHASSGKKDVKGYHTILLPAVKAADLPFNVAEYNTSRLAPEQMPEFYRKSSVALCASEYEGASNSVMEAMASGLAVVATDVGNHGEMVESQKEHLGDTGILLVERTPEAFEAALRSLTPARVREMGRLNRLEIAERWSWDAWADRYTDFFRMALNA